MEVYADVDPISLLAHGLREQCPTRPLIWINRDDPSQWFWASCRTYACPVCGPELLIADAAAVGMTLEESSGSSSFCTLELAPHGLQARARAMEVFRRALMRNNRAFDWVWTTERGANGMLHIHVLTRGDALAPAHFGDAWAYGGVTIEPTWTPMAAALYLVKDARNPLLRDGARDLNGKSYLHTSRGFWGGSTKAEVVGEIRGRIRPRSNARWAVAPATSRS